MKRIKRMKYSQLFKEIGDPETDKGLEAIQEDSVLVELPFALNNGSCDKIRCNRRIVAGLADAFQEILDKFGIDFIKKHGLDEFNGCFNCRQTRNGRWWSIHSWMGAVDLCASKNKMRQPPMLPYWFVEAFKKRGFYWGGDWKMPYTDGMHLSMVDG